MSFLSEFLHETYEPWKAEYVAYEAIFNGLHDNCDRGRWSSKDEKDFENVMRLEANKVDMFINRKEREIHSRLGYYQRSVRQNSVAPDTKKNSTEEALKEVLADINGLYQFTRTNFKAIQHLIKEHDRLTNTNRSDLLVDICRVRPLDNQRFDGLLVKVSSLIDVCRDRLTSTPTMPVIQHSNIDTTVTARYWVHRDNATEVKSILLFNLPIYADTPAEEFEQTEKATTMVYLDNDNFDQYSARLECDDKCEIISIQWSGASLSDFVQIEKKTLVKTNSGSEYQQESIIIERNCVQDFLSGIYTADHYRAGLTSKNPDKVEQCYTAACSIQKSIRDKRLFSKLRVCFNRLLFKSSGDETLSVSLDENVTIVKEASGSEWCRHDVQPPYQKKSTGDVEVFPFVILETKLQGGQQQEWLAKLLGSKLVYEVPRFSTFLHGIAHFWGPQLPLLPWWLSRMKTDIRNTPSPSGNLTAVDEITGLTRSTSVKPLIDGKYRIGYLESQLGKKQTVNSDHGSRLSRRQSSHVSVNSSNYISYKESKGGYEYISPTTTARLSRHSSHQQLLKDNPEFLDIYYSDRNERSQAYKFQNVDTVKKSDLDREAAIIEIDENDKKMKKAKKKMKKPPMATIEPKVFFANERTFIHWLQFSAIIMTISLTLLNFGDRVSTIAGCAFFGVSMIVSIYAFFRYRYRAYQISNTPHLRYDDLYGPAMLCVLLLGATALNFALRWEHPSPTDTYLGTNNQTQQQNPQSS